MTNRESLLNTPLYILDSEAMHGLVLDKARDADDAVGGVRLVDEWAIIDTPAGILMISAAGDGLLRTATDERPALIDVLVDSARTRAATPTRMRLTVSEVSELSVGPPVAFGDFVRTRTGQQRWLPLIACALRGESTDETADGLGRLTARQRADIAAVVTECDAAINFGDAFELVAEIDVHFARHGAFRGGNRWGLLGTFIAMQIERVLGATRPSAP